MGKVQFDRRRCARIALDAKCRILGDDGSSIEAAVLDLSSAGIGVLMRVALPVHARYMLAADLPGSTAPKRLNGWGVVMYRVQTGETYRTGFAFMDMDSCSKSYLVALERELE
ncbi:PilZ domain-containing protein [Herbaspirillum sp. HC18]|nr:PilZ domain-containing protein [Herbaspirillum sp. HC18]